MFPTRFSARIHEGDLFYIGFWVALMGAFMGSAIWILVRIEKNTRDA